MQGCKFLLVVVDVWSFGSYHREQDTEKAAEHIPVREVAQEEAYIEVEQVHYDVDRRKGYSYNSNEQLDSRGLIREIYDGSAEFAFVIATIQES